MSRRRGNGRNPEIRTPSVINQNTSNVSTIIISKLKQVNYMDIVKSIIVPFIIAFGVVDYQMNNQSISERQSTAKQLSTEIELLNPNLQEYASYYKKGFDLDVGGKNPEIEPNVDNYFIISTKNNSALPNILKANESGYYLYHLTIISLHNGTGDFSWPNIYPPNTVFFAKLDTPIIPPPLYNEHGMYYLYAKDISNFDTKEFTDLYLFYTQIAKAESDRASLQTYLSTYGYNDELKGQYFNTYMDMRLNILNAAKIEPKVIEELNNETNSTSLFFS